MLFTRVWNRGVLPLSMRLLILGALITPRSGIGTVQVKDQLVYKGRTYTFPFTPLEVWRCMQPAEPVLFALEHASISSACWRGYRAFWEVADGHLYLTGIRTCDHANPYLADLEELFGEEHSEGRVLASWVTGEFFVPVGRVSPAGGFAMWRVVPRSRRWIVFEAVQGEIVRVERRRSARGEPDVPRDLADLEGAEDAPGSYPCLSDTAPTKGWVTVKGSLRPAQQMSGELNIWFRAVDRDGSTRYGADDKAVFSHEISLHELGPWEVEVPEDLGELGIYAWCDRSGSGRTGNPAAAITVHIGQDSLCGVELLLSCGQL